MSGGTRVQYPFQELIAFIDEQRAIHAVLKVWQQLRREGIDVVCCTVA